MIKRILSRLKLSRICADYDAGALGCARQNQKKADDVLSNTVIYVTSAVNIQAGAPVFIQSFCGDLSPSDAYRHFINKRLVLNVNSETVKTGSKEDAPHGYLLENLQAGKIARCVLNNVYFKILKIDDDKNLFLNSFYQQTESENAAFKIITKTKIINNKSLVVFSVLRNGSAQAITEISNTDGRSRVAKYIPDVDFVTSCEFILYTDGSLGLKVDKVASDYIDIITTDIKTKKDVFLKA